MGILLYWLKLFLVLDILFNQIAATPNDIGKSLDLLNLLESLTDINSISPVTFVYLH